MILRTDILSYARTLVGTPFQHQGRLPRVGLDCIGLLIVVAEHFGIPCPDADHGYSRSPDAVSFMEGMSQRGVEIPVKEAKPGDVLTFWVRHRRYPQHASLATNRGMIHSYFSFKPVGVVEDTITPFWRKRLVKCFRFRGVEENTPLSIPWQE